MPTADQVIAWFERNAGLKEDPDRSNCTWISRWFYEKTGKASALAPGCYAWCAVTVSRALNEAWGDADVWQVPDVRADWTPGFSYVPSVRVAFDRSGLFTTDPGEARRGDLVIFDWDGDGWGDHIGVFVKDVDGATCLVWEGNTADNDISLRRRPHSLIAGFCRVPYDQEDDDMYDAGDREKLDTVVADVGHLKRVTDELKVELQQAAGAKSWFDVGEGLADKLAGKVVGTLDYDRLATAVADKLAERLSR